MKINFINASNSFKRAIPVSTHSYSEKSGRELDNKTIELAKVLNSKKSSVYNDKTALKIKDFFKSVLGDYNGQNGIEFRKIPEENTLVLLSGKDLKAIKQLEIDQRPIKKDIHKSKTMSIKKKKRSIQELHAQVDAEIMRRLEDGVKGKPKSYINLQTNYSDNKISSIKYSTKKLFYTALVDGFIDKSKPITFQPTEVNKAQNFIYEEKTINCLA